MDYKELISPEHVEQLRDRFLKLSTDYSMSVVARAIGISRQTLYRFLFGERVYGYTLRKIMRWCEKQEV